MHVSVIYRSWNALVHCTHTLYYARVCSKTMHSLLCITSKKLPFTTLCYIASRFILMDVTKISSCRVNTSSRRGIKQGFLLVLSFFYFPMKVAGGATFTLAGGNPRPPVLNDNPEFLPWNFRARLYYSAASQPRVFVRLRGGNHTSRSTTARQLGRWLYLCRDKYKLSCSKWIYMPTFFSKWNAPWS